MEDNNQQLKDIKNLLLENIEYSKRNAAKIEKIEKHILISKIVNIIKLTIILIPIVLAIIYLPPLISRLISNYQDIFSQIGQLKSGEIEQLSPDILKNILP